ncbi:hypothetical protein CKF59_06240 [Psittacicella gerlachiana]|uniref:Uncharacterized protein n=2 Tax=Psittacicella gerlachiana TaxID=2028574 RepID=A0A3A1Y913_9GAMM|nr:hypothetical protein CKF59_06240 [Psittacicella gerlachiana]
MPLYGALGAVILMGLKSPYFSANVIFTFFLLTLEAMLFSLIMLRNKRIGIYTSIETLRKVAVVRYISCLLLFTLIDFILMYQVAEYKLINTFVISIITSLFAMAIPAPILLEVKQGIHHQVSLYEKYTDEFLHNLVAQTFNQACLAEFTSTYNQNIQRLYDSDKHFEYNRMIDAAKTHSMQNLLQAHTRELVEEKTLETMSEEVKRLFQFADGQEHLIEEFKRYVKTLPIDFAYIERNLGKE